MKYDEMIKKVQTVAQIPSQAEAEKAVQVTLETLSERVIGDEASHLADQLPEKVGQYLRGREGENGKHFSLQEFYSKVSEKEHVEAPTAANHVRAVFATLQEAVTPGEFEDIRNALSQDDEELFAV